VLAVVARITFFGAAVEGETAHTANISADSAIAILLLNFIKFPFLA
jgi:hypothetical protein